MFTPKLQFKNITMIKNDQKPWANLHAHSAKLQVHSIFLTIQGEGPFTGHRAIFIRLAGCNLQCPQCDTEYTNQNKHMSVDEIYLEVIKAEWDIESPIIVITGGEPFRQNISRLVTKLQHDHVVCIETNGTVFPHTEGAMHDADLHAAYTNAVIICSPKTPKINPVLSRYINNYKYVLTAGEIADDGLPERVLLHGKNRVARPPALTPSDEIYIYPADEHDAYNNNLNRKAVIKSCLQFNYIAGVQIHKILEVE